MGFRLTSNFVLLALCSLSQLTSLSYGAPTSKDACSVLAKYADERAMKIPGKEAYDCLLSPAYDHDRSVNVYTQMRKFAHLLSSQAFFNKPDDLPLIVERVDLNGTFDAIKKKLDSKAYKNDYEFNRDLTELFGGYHDGHTLYSALCQNGFGQFMHDYPLVSIVAPGEDVPRIYLADPESGEVGEEIVEIAGDKALDHLLKLVKVLRGPSDAGWVDADTRWNGLFVGRHAIGVTPGNFAARDLYPGTDFKMKTAAGKVIDVQWYVEGPGVMSDPQGWKNLFQSTASYEKFMCLNSPKENDSPDDTDDTKPPQTTHVPENEDDPDYEEPEHPEEDEHPEDKDEDEDEDFDDNPEDDDEFDDDDFDDDQDDDFDDDTKPDIDEDEHDEHWDDDDTKPDIDENEHDEDWDDDDTKPDIDENEHDEDWDDDDTKPDIDENEHDEHWDDDEDEHRDDDEDEDESHETYGSSNHHLKGHPKVSSGNHRNGRPEHVSSNNHLKGHPKISSEHRVNGHPKIGSHHRNGRPQHVPSTHTKGDSNNKKPNFHFLDFLIEKRKLKRRDTDFDVEWYKTLAPRDGNTIEDFSSLKLSDKPPVAYPEVETRLKGTEQSLHFLQAYPDVAVWGFHVFQSRETPAPNNVQFFYYWRSYMIDNLKLLKEKKIKRLILDFSNNGGGSVVLGMETVRRFFPEAQPFYGVDYRRSPLVDHWLELTNVTAGLNKLDNTPFKSVGEFLNPPVAKRGDYFSKIGRFNQLGSSQQEIPGVEFTDKGNPPFDLENIVILTDGQCGSTCAITVEALSSIGVPTIVTGGQPSKTKPKTMQYIGGIKGYQVLDLPTVKLVHEYPIPPEVKDYTVESVGIQLQARMNFRNSYTSDDHEIPQEFLFQPADAHLWYTKQMINDRTILWNDVVKLTWDDKGKNKLLQSHKDENKKHIVHGDINPFHKHKPNKAGSGHLKQPKPGYHGQRTKETLKDGVLAEFDDLATGWLTGWGGRHH